MVAMVVMRMTAWRRNTLVELLYKGSRQTLRTQHRNPAGSQVARHIAAGKQPLQQQRERHQRQ